MPLRGNTHRTPRTARTRWGRFTAVCVAGTVGITVLGAGIATGQLPMNIAVSGQNFIGTFSAVGADGITVYPRSVDTAAGSKPSIAVKVDQARLTDVCLSTVARGLPLLGDVTLFARVPGAGVTADTLVVDVASVSGSVDVEEIRLGLDARALGDTPSTGTSAVTVGTSLASETGAEIIALTAAHASVTGLTVSAQTGDLTC